MAVILKKAKPTSPGRRGLVEVIDTDWHRGEPCRALLEPTKQKAGRNNNGRITVRHRGGGHKRRYRKIDFKRNKSVPGVVERLEYDPNRSATIALILYKDGERRYIIAPEGLKKGMPVQAGVEAPIAVGNALPLSHIPEGSTVHCVEMKEKKGAQIARSAGSSVKVLSREGEKVNLRLSSGSVIQVSLNCMATIGKVGFSEHSLRSLGTAGASRRRGRRPTVRGVAMNPVDHPHGGGEGRTSGGRHPVSPWGVPTKGYRTRRNKRTQYMIVRRRDDKK